MAKATFWWGSKREKEEKEEEKKGGPGLAAIRSGAHLNSTTRGFVPKSFVSDENRRVRHAPSTSLLRAARARSL